MLDFQIQDKDTGIDDADSVQPYNNAENADENVLRRTPENLRTRSEVIRKAVDEMRAIAGLDRAMALVASPAATVAWGGAKDVTLSSTLGTGIPTLSAPAGVGTGAVTSIAIQSLLSNAKLLDNSTPDAAYVVGDTAIMPKLARTDSGETLTFTSLKRPWENGNNIYMRLYDAGVSQVPKAQATVEGTLDGSGNPQGPVTIHISLSNPGGGIDATHQDVINAITGTAATLVAATSTLTTALAFEIKDGTDPGKGVPLEGGVDSESFSILQASWNTFFVTTDNRLAEGDVLVFIFPDAEARRKQGGSPESTLRVIRNSENVDNSDVVPICKVIQDRLVFMNGTVIERGQTVKLVPDQSLRNDLAVNAGGSAGDTLVGADAKSQSGAALAQGTVFSQMTSLLDQHGTLVGEYDNHKVGTADRHALSQIDNKPFFVVHPTAGYGDYTTIQAAINAIAANASLPGIVHIHYKSGGYIEELSFTGLNGRSLTLVGEDNERVVIRSNTSNPAVSISAMDTGDSIEFTNLSFTANSPGPHFISITADMSDVNQKVVFRNCRMLKQTTTADMIYVTGSPRIEFHGCVIGGVAYTDSVGWGWIDSDSGPTIHVHNCRIVNTRHLLLYKSTGSDPGHVSVCDNEVYRCCYNKSDGSVITGLIHSETIGTAFQSIKVSWNVWRDNGLATPNENSGSLIQASGPGVVSNNILRQPVHYQPTAANGIINAPDCTIASNHIEPGECTAIVGNDAPVVGNHILDFKGGAANMPAIYADGCLVAGNRINCSTITAPVCTTVMDLVGSSDIADGNYIENAPAVIGIRVAGTHSSVTGNVVVYNTAGGIGISVLSSANYSTISNNSIRNTKNGINVASYYNAIVGNRIDFTGTGVLYGISTGVSSTGNTISGNSIYGPASDGVGVSVSGDYNTICGNSVSFTDIGFSIGGDGNTLTGNISNSPLTYCCAIGGDYNAVAGNRWRKSSGTVLNDVGTENGVQFESHATNYSMKYNNPKLV